MTAGAGDELLASIVATTPDLLAYFERRVDPRPDAADLLSDALVQAWRRADAAPRDEEGRRMWLFGIARNVLLNHSRSKRRRSALADRIRQHLVEAAIDPDPAEALAVRDAVRRLQAGQRELVMLIHWDGFSIQEAGQILGIGASTARSRYAAARTRLAASLAEPLAVHEAQIPDETR